MPYSLLCLSLMSCVLLTKAVGTADGKDLTFASPFSDHMVLQRDVPLRVWGTADANAQVQVTLGTHTATGKADKDGHWQINLDKLPASGPITLSVRSGSSEAKIEDVLVGDVFLCAGQSNMQMTLRETDITTEIESAGQLQQVRLFVLPKKPAPQPLTTFDAKWQVSSPESAASFSAVGFQFARALRNDPSLANVPIGLIDNSCGGTAAEAWISAPTLAANFKSEQLLDSIFGIKPAEMFNGMVAPIANLKLKAVLWYQGESNVPKADLYVKMLSTMIGEWRTTFGQPELPFLIVQLPNYPGHKGMDSFAGIREAQSVVARDVKNAALAITIDNLSGFDLHPKHKRFVGERLALLARKHLYNQDVLCDGPEFASAAVENGNRIRVRFAPSKSALTNHNTAGPLRGFMVAGEDQEYHYADAVIDGDSVLVSCPSVPKPLTVRYAWTSFPDADLFNAAGLPAAPFRTDTLPAVSPIELQLAPAVRRVATDRYEATISGAGILTSLFVDGKQFVSNEGAGGLTVDGFFAPRNLLYVKDHSPREVAFSDGSVSINYHFDSDRLTLRIKNDNDAEAHAHLDLAAPVKADKTLASRDSVSMTVNGFDSIEALNGGSRLSITLPPKTEKVIELRPSAK